MKHKKPEYIPEKFYAVAHTCIAPIEDPKTSDIRHHKTKNYIYGYRMLYDETDRLKKYYNTVGHSHQTLINVWALFQIQIPFRELHKKTSIRIDKKNLEKTEKSIKSIITALETSDDIKFCIENVFWKNFITNKFNYNLYKDQSKIQQIIQTNKLSIENIYKIICHAERSYKQTNLTDFLKEFLEYTQQLQIDIENKEIPTKKQNNAKESYIIATKHLDKILSKIKLKKPERLSLIIDLLTVVFDDCNVNEETVRKNLDS